MSKTYADPSTHEFLGAAPLDAHPQARMQALIGDDASFTQVWGMTEVSSGPSKALRQHGGVPLS